MPVRYPAIVSFTLLLTACGSVENQRSSTIMVDGRAYELRTSTISGRNGTFERSRIIVKNRAYTCLPDSPGDCEAAVRQARSESGSDR